MTVLAIILGALAALILIAWLGIKLTPAPFPSFAASDGPTETRPLPAGLPAPVERYYRQTYGERVPVIRSASIQGRGTMAPFRVPLPFRFRFLYDGSDYSSLFHVTFLKKHILTGKETYIDGHALGLLPGGRDEGAWFDQGMAARVWCEILVWLPAMLLTDPRVCWQALDEDTAILTVPQGQREEHIVVRFNPLDGSVHYFEAYKFKDATHKELWVNAMWLSIGRRWITLNIEEKLINVPVNAAIRN